MDVLVDAGYRADDLDAERAAAVCEFAMRRLGLSENTEVSISFVDDEEMAELNEEYRAKTGPTDVLSFECDNLEDGFPGAPEGLYSLGDIVVAPDVAERQARDYASTLADEIDLLLVHGILHLNGYDHIEDDEAAEMEALQTSILTAWRAQVAKLSHGDSNEQSEEGEVKPTCDPSQALCPGTEAACV